MQNGPDTEPLRRAAAAVIMVGGWGGCIGVGMYAILEFDPNHGNFAPQWVGLAFILLMGIAIAGTLARSRMRLTRAILAAFVAGGDAQREDTDRRVRSLVTRLDRDEKGRVDERAERKLRGEGN